MSWRLGAFDLPAPSKKVVELNIQSATHRTLNGSNTRDYIGNEKKIIVCEWDFISRVDYDRIATVRNSQINSGIDPLLIIHEDGFEFNGTVIVDLPEINFNLPNHYNYRNIKIAFIER